ncbi:hypothetical protein, partial [Mycobacterium sp.]|uniref:hypothetical protein n=1 Tax=Mycobacterium sp. TaxID=1785 RepID=UPI0031D04503
MKFSENEIKTIKDKELENYVLERLYLSGFSKEELEETAKLLDTELKNEYLPIDTPHDELEDLIPDFFNNTKISDIKIQLYSGHLIIYSDVKETRTDKNGNEFEVHTYYGLKTVWGKIFQYLETDIVGEGDTQIQKMLKPKLPIKIRLVNVYLNMNTYYIQYRIGKDRKDRTNTEEDAINDIISEYHLTNKEAFLLKIYFDECITLLLPFSLKSNEPFYIKDGIISVNYPINYDIKEELQNITKLYNITTQKKIMSLLFNYAPLLLFEKYLKEDDLKIYFPYISGKSEEGKSAMSKFVICNGFDNFSLELSGENLRTLASMRNNLSSTIYPVVINEITQDIFAKIYPALKDLSTGSAIQSRGALGWKNKTWELTSIPIFTSNEEIYIDSGISSRLIVVHPEAGKNDIISWYNNKKKINNGFLFILLKELNDKNVDEITSGIMKLIEAGFEPFIAYQTFINNMWKDIFKRNGLECPFTIVQREEQETDWYEIFISYVKEQIKKAENLSYSTYMEGYDYIIEKDDIYITKIGFMKFLKAFNCPYRNMLSFAENNDTSIKIEYVKRRIKSFKNPVHVLKVKEIEDIQLSLNTDNQLESKII